MTVEAAKSVLRVQVNLRIVLRHGQALYGLSKKLTRMQVIKYNIIR
jgi:hypothetical protein